MSWSLPSVGRMQLPSSPLIWGDPPGTTTAISATNTASTTWSPSGTQNPFTGATNRHVCFVGGGFRMYQTTLNYIDGTKVSDTSSYWSGTANVANAAPDQGFLRLLRQPRLTAIDMETGVNLFRYVWPWIYQKVSPAGSGGLFPIRARGTSLELPYALADLTALDLLSGSAVGNDGFVDHVFVGDLGGNFFTVRFNFSGTTGQGIQIDTRLTKSVNEGTGVTSYSNYRGVPQPITTAASVSVDALDSSFVRAIVGAGKYNDVYHGVADDKTDPATTSIYNAKVLLALPSVPTSASGSYTLGGNRTGRFTGVHPVPVWKPG